MPDDVHPNNRISPMLGLHDFENSEVSQFGQADQSESSYNAHNGNFGSSFAQPQFDSMQIEEPWSGKKPQGKHLPTQADQRKEAALRLE